MKILVLDFETTGVDSKTCLPIEFAAQSYDTVTKARGVPFSHLIWDETYPEISSHITELTGITNEELREKGVNPHTFRRDLLLISDLPRSDILCAYNASFDREVLKQMMLRLGATLTERPWLCAMGPDFPWPDNMLKCRKLQHRALDIGLKMDSRPSHRAVSDVSTVCDIFDLFDMEEVLAYWRLPNRYIIANVPKPWHDQGKGIEAAKKNSFGWEYCHGETEHRFPKTWVKRVKEGHDLDQYPFPVILLDNPA